MFARVWSNWNSHSLLVGMENSMTTLKRILSVFFFKLKIYLPYDSAIPSLFIYTPPKKKKKRERAYVHTKICTPMFIIALFEIIKNGKQSRRIPENEQINNFWHICTIEWYSPIRKRNNWCRQKHDLISK